jgi:hypothetical protein
MLQRQLQINLSKNKYCSIKNKEYQEQQYLYKECQYMKYWEQRVLYLE